MNSIIQYLFFSVCIILVGHFIWNTLLEKYTQKKIKNIGNIQNEKYKQLFNELEETIKKGTTTSSGNYMNVENTPPYLEDEDKISMIHELSTYMSSL